MERYCIDCHDSVEAKGEVDLEAALFESEHKLEKDGHLLKLIQRTLTEEEMPPPQKKRQPTKQEREILVKEIADMYQKLADSQRDDPGHVVMQRLTKEEYRNVLRDLTGGIVTNAGVYLPNEGGAGEGFNNVGEAQGMGTTQVEK